MSDFYDILLEKLNSGVIPAIEIIEPLIECRTVQQVLDDYVDVDRELILIKNNLTIRREIFKPVLINRYRILTFSSSISTFV